VCILNYRLSGDVAFPRFNDKIIQRDFELYVYNINTDDLSTP